MSGKDRVKVAVRVRPFSKREEDAGSRCVVSMGPNTTTIMDPRSQQVRTFTFDYSYWSHSGFLRNKEGLFVPEEPGGRYADQSSVFQDLGQAILENALQGYNATLLAYGQTGSGKSYSMVGYGPNKGLVPTLCERLFQAVKVNQDTCQFQVFFSMLEIYNEQVNIHIFKSETLGPRSGGGLKVREDQQRGFYVEGLRRVACKSGAQVERMMEQGTRTRTTAATHLNASSSRSHMLITLQLKQVLLLITKESTINLVDLAGSERQRTSGSEADRLKEGTAINLSLTTLGNVISSLADAALGKRVVHIPYRDSVITKLLQPALGGNSRTIMVATLSPADMCYEESLSTLRYAERAKRIQNRAVVNESPTEHLLKELKAENAKLLTRLSRLADEGRQASSESSTALRSRPQLTPLQETMIQTFPYILNVNEDPQLSGVVKLFIQEGRCPFPLSIQEKHAAFTNLDRQVTITPVSQAKVTVNGSLISSRTELHHLDRLILGSNSTYLFIGFPLERNAEDWSRYDYDYFQSELAAAEGIHIHSLCSSSDGRGQPDPSLLAVFYDYIKLMPMVAEANQMSQELRKGVQFKLEIKNLAMSDSMGHDLEKEIAIRVTSEETKQVWVWSKAKFVNRKFLMEELYQQQVAEGAGSGWAPPPRDRDPFWDPLEPLHLGSAHLWLQSLAFRIRLEEQVEVLGPEGSEEAILQTQLVPCSPAGLPLGEDAILIDPTELLDKRQDFQLVLERCCGLRWLKEARDRGVQIGFRMYTLPQAFYAPSVWHNMNPVLDHRVQFTVMKTSQDFLNYLQTNALVLDLWGLQGMLNSWTGLSPPLGLPNARPCYRLPLSKKWIIISVLCSSRLRSVSAMAPLFTVPLSVVPGVEPSRRSERRGSLRPSCDAEFARALKVFYHSMTTIRGQLQKLRCNKPKVGRSWHLQFK
uniref:Kinesin-like protein n=1 Tax=Scleropages formosus TaxID=113540 RepID=A0A8C9V7K7_SCLFO